MSNITLPLAQYLAKWQHTDHIWGETDCMLFAIGFHDERFNTFKSNALYRQYYSRHEAIRFYKNFLSVEGWLQANGYNKVEELQDGDFVVVKNKLLDQGYYYFQGSFVTMDEERGLIRIQADLIDYDSAWRK